MYVYIVEYQIFKLITRNTIFFSLTQDGGTPLHLAVIHYTQCDETQCKIVTSITEG